MLKKKTEFQEKIRLLQELKTRLALIPADEDKKGKCDATAKRVLQSNFPYSYEDLIKVLIEKLGISKQRALMGLQMLFLNDSILLENDLFILNPEILEKGGEA